VQITNSELSYLVLKVLTADCVSLERKQNNPLNGAAGNQQSISTVICWIRIDSRVITRM